MTPISPTADSPRRNASEANVNQSPHLSGRVGKPTGCSQAEPEEVSALRASPPRAAWTPGPWRIVPDAFRVGNLRIVSFHPSAVAKVYADEPSDTDEKANANARLIAAAPELYEALAGAFNLMGTTTDCLNSGEPSRHRYAEQRLQREMDQIRAVLRKARGGDA